MSMSLRFVLETLRRLRGDQRGQAMVEYSTLTLWMGLLAGGTCYFYMGPMLLNAIDKYLDSVYFVLNLPLP